MSWNAYRPTFPLIACAILALAGCATLTKPWNTPEVSLAGLRATELGLARQSFIVRLRVRNPNDRTLPIKAMTYRLFLEDNELANGAGELDRQIPAFGEETVEVEVNGNLLALVPQLPILAMKQGDLAWKISGTLTVAGGLITLPYRYSGEIDPKALLSQASR